MSEEGKVGTQAPQKSFVERVIDAMKGGDEGKLAKFHSRLVKSLSDQTRLRMNEIDDLTEQEEELMEEFNDAVVSIDLGNISTREKSKAHVGEYIEKLASKLSSVEDIRVEIKDKRAEIARLAEISSAIGA